MFRKIAITFALSMLAGAGFAAGGTAAGINIGSNSSMPVTAQFNALDSNGDGHISPVEAEASPELCALYDGFDTAETIETGAPSAGVPGITLAQFRAGVAALGEGTLGPAVSGAGLGLDRSAQTIDCSQMVQEPVAAY